MKILIRDIITTFYSFFWEKKICLYYFFNPKANNAEYNYIKVKQTTVISLDAKSLGKIEKSRFIV